MNSLIQECLKSIEALDMNSYEKEMAVCEAFIDTYDRAAQVLEYYRGDDLSPLQLFASEPVQQIIVEDATISTGNAPDANQQQTANAQNNESPLLDNKPATTNAAAKTPVSSESKEASLDDSKKSKEDLWEFEFRHNKSGSKEKEHILVSILLVVPRFIQAIGRLIWRGLKRIFTGKEAVKKNEQIVSAEIDAISKKEQQSSEEVAKAIEALARTLYHNADGGEMTPEQLQAAQREDVVKTQVKMQTVSVDQKKYPFILGIKDKSARNADNIRANVQGTNDAGVLVIYPTFNAIKLVEVLKEYHATCVSKIDSVFDTLINSANDQKSSGNFDTVNKFFDDRLPLMDQIVKNSKALRALQEQTGQGNVTIPDTDISTAPYMLTIDGIYLCGDQLAKITELILKSSEELNKKLESLKAAKKKEEGYSKETIKKAKILINNLKSFNEKMSQLSNAYMELSTAVEKQSNWLVSACKKIHAGGVALVNKGIDKGKQVVQQVKDNRAEQRKVVDAQRQAAQATIDKYSQRTPAGKSSIGLSDDDYARVKQQRGNQDLNKLDNTNPLNLNPESGFENYRMPSLQANSAEVEVTDGESVFNEQTESYFQSDNIEGVAY